MQGWLGELRVVRHGLVLSLTAVLYGWGLGIVFGAGEDWLREGTLARAEAARALYLEKAKGDPEAATVLIKRMDETCWRYFQRAHLHAGGIGGIALGASLLLGLLSGPAGPRALTSGLLGFGAIGYPLFWMLAALRAPGLGATALAKESLQWLAMPSAGALVVGAVLTLYLVTRRLYVSSPGVAPAVALLLLAGGVAAPARAQEKGDGPMSLFLAYRCAPERRAAFRAHMEGEGLRQLEAWKREGVFTGYAALFSSYVNASTWDMLLRLDFARYAQTDAWRAIERTRPGGLSPEALALCSPVSSDLADLWLAAAGGSGPRGAFLVVPYQMEVGKGDYKKYVEGYVKPQMDGWVEQKVLAGWSMYLNHHTAGAPWDSLLVLEYAGTAGLAQRELVKDGVRRRLAQDPAWKALSDSKQNVRSEGQVVVAEPLARP